MLFRSTDPSYVDAKSTLALLLQFGYNFGFIKDKNTIDEALKLIDDGIAIEPDNAELYSTKGTLYFAKKDWPGMYTAFDKAYELAPNNISVLNTVGMYTTWEATALKSR